MTTQEIKKLVEQEMGINDLADKTRKSEYVIGRTIYFVLCKRHTTASLSAMGKRVNRDHSTALHGIRLFDNVWMNNIIHYKRELITLQTLEEKIETGFSNLRNRTEIFEVYKVQEAKINKLQQRVMELEQENQRLSKYEKYRVLY